MALNCVLRQTEMYLSGYLVIAVFLLHLSAVSGQTSTTSIIVLYTSPTTGTPMGTTGSISPTKSTPSLSSSSTLLTQASVATPVTKPTTKESSRRFDGASFVGGIILGAFLTIIFILVYKWWQGRSKSYHSL